MQKLIARFLLVLAIAGAAVIPLAKMQRSQKPQGINQLLFFPSRYPEGDWAPDDLAYDDVYFSAEDGTRLHGWFCPVEEPVATILFAHGNAGHVAARAHLLRHLQSEAKASVFAFDYRGFGRSDGVPSIEGALQDAKAARSKLRDLAGIKASEMLLMGESLGGAIMVQLAAELPPRGLILQSTFSSLRGIAEVHYPNQASVVPPKTLNSVAQIGRFNGPLLQSHGETDRVIPLALGRKLFRAANEPKQFLVLDGAGHNDWLTAEYLRRLEGFIDSVDARQREPSSEAELAQ